MDRYVLLTSTPECVVSPRGETTHSGVDVYNTHLSIINPSIKIPQCGCMEDGLNYIMFYVKKHIAHVSMCYNPPLVRDKPLGTPASVKLVCW